MMLYKNCLKRNGKIRRDSEQQLINELYKIQSFDWGGSHQNSLETTIVNRYVKQITSYESLNEEIEGSLHNSLRAKEFMVKIKIVPISVLFSFISTPLLVLAQ